MGIGSARAAETHHRTSTRRYNTNTYISTDRYGKFMADIQLIKPTKKPMWPQRRLGSVDNCKVDRFRRLEVMVDIDGATV